MNFIKRNADRILLYSLLLVLVILLINYGLNILKREDTDTSATVIDNIDEYNYSFNNRDGELFESYFKELKDTLSKETVDYEIYAKLVSQLFVIDFYTLDTKITNMDIGGTQFLHTKMVDNFILKATDTIYKNVKSNINNDRVQELPKVSSTMVDAFKIISYKYDNVTEAYEVNINVEYEVDLDYPDKVTILLIKQDNKLVIIDVK